MAGDRSRYRLLCSACGAVLLAISVFLPWYGVSLTEHGVAVVGQVGDQIAAQFGNSSLQSEMGAMHAHLAGLAGQQLTALTAHQALREMNVVLLVVAALALLDALVALVRTVSPLPDGAGAAVVLLGSVATVCVLYRIVSPPTPQAGLLALSVREGAWLAMAGSLMMVVSGLWPRSSASPPTIQAQVHDTWSGLSGWTPGG
ncbi:MAG: hypothetical protein QOI03_2187 [Solirubrobacteraceae bacterium]|jgi:hypothetical protein|nr:hypothetical protein [Solirubrobacteraceae bacterium]